MYPLWLIQFRMSWFLLVKILLFSWTKSWTMPECLAFEMPSVQDNHNLFLMTKETIEQSQVEWSTAAWQQCKTALFRQIQCPNHTDVVRTFNPFYYQDTTSENPDDGRFLLTPNKNAFFLAVHSEAEQNKPLDIHDVYNPGQKCWDTCTFSLKTFPFRFPPPPLPLSKLNQRAESAHFRSNIDQGGGGTSLCANAALQSVENRATSEHLSYFQAVPRTFVQDCLNSLCRRKTTITPTGWMYCD